VYGIRLPTGYNYSTIPILIEVPDDYPLSPPGVGDSHIYLPRALRYQGRVLKDFHEHSGFRGNNQWSWFCYQQIDWDPNYDDLISFIEMVRADLADPEPKEETRSNIHLLDPRLVAKIFHLEQDGSDLTSLLRKGGIR